MRVSGALSAGSIAGLLKSYQSRQYFILIGIAATLPLSIRLNGLFVALLLLNWLSSRKVTLKAVGISTLVPFYLLHVIGVAYSLNTDQALFELEKKLSFLVLPLAMAGASNLSAAQVKGIVLTFVGSCTLVAVVCVIVSVRIFFLTGSTENFFYHSLTRPFEMHAVYMAMYVSLCVFALYQYFGDQLFAKRHWKTVMISSLVVFLVCFLFLLSARTVTACFLLIVLLGLSRQALLQGRWVRPVAMITLLVVLVSGLVFLIPTNLERVKEAINYKNEYTIKKQYGGRSTRELIWSADLTVIERNPLFGVGTGDAEDELQRVYREDEDKNWPLLYRPGFTYNAHNQYFQTMIELGIPGLFLLLTCLGFSAYRAYHQKEFLTLSFLALFAVSCLTESMFGLNKGIVFFSFFLSVLCANDSRTTAEGKTNLQEP